MTENISDKKRIYSSEHKTRNNTQVSWGSCIGRQILYHWDTWEACFEICLVFFFNWSLNSVQFSCSVMSLRPHESQHTRLEKAMAPYSRTLAWKIPWTEEPGWLQSVGWLRVGHDWATSLSLFTFMHWRRQWHPTPVFLPGESRGRGSLAGCRLWGRTESDMTAVT